MQRTHSAISRPSKLNHILTIFNNGGGHKTTERFVTYFSSTFRTPSGGIAFTSRSKLESKHNMATSTRVYTHCNDERRIQRWTTCNKTDRLLSIVGSEHLHTGCL